MNLSNREIEIILHILRSNNGVTIDSLVKRIGVSKRTIYRELSSIEESLIKLGVQLVKQEGLYTLVGSNNTIEALNNMISNKGSYDDIISPTSRQSSLVCQILLRSDVITIKELSDNLSVSVATVTQDLKAIEPLLNEYKVKLVRIKAKGLTYDGEEDNIRRVISGILSSEINEYEFFEYIDNQKLQSTTTTSYFIKLFDRELLIKSGEAIKSKLSEDLSKLSDSQLKQITIVLAISAMRINDNNPVNNLNDSSNIQMQYKKIASDLYKFFNSNIVEKVNLLELDFLANQIQNMHFSTEENVLSDNYDLELSYNIKDFVKKVSQGYNYDFNNLQLINDLLSHVGSMLNRNMNKLPEINNATLEEIITKYPKLFALIRASWNDTFNAKLARSDIAYLLLHFASEYEKQKKHRYYKILLVCSNGIGTARILESRLKETLPYNNEYIIARINDLKTIDFSEYDLILSTNFLPGFSYPYKVISPLILDNEVEDIRSSLEAIEPIYDKSDESNDLDPLKQLSELSIVTDHSMKLIDYFKVRYLDSNNSSMKEILLNMTSKLDHSIVEDTEMVALSLFKRMEKSPVGIPNTDSGLIHSRSEYVNKPFFGVFRLSNPILIKSMDGNSTNLRNCIYMISPNEIDVYYQKLLGAISSSIIENDNNLDIYQNGNDIEIKELLARIFIEQIKINDWK
ncbi:BglG family transcription antiterminator [Lactobacillus terrae]|uniref:BglG family transcription antiterminator n=1 Tax=Lactobacillus terrae TaxID=2269374 RepID=UPI000C1B6111|nr:helix-turn-helix domain-containing protein [Lactobacillus terrae]